MSNLSKHFKSSGDPQAFPAPSYKDCVLSPEEQKAEAAKAPLVKPAIPKKVGVPQAAPTTAAVPPAAAAPPTAAVLPVAAAPPTAGVPPVAAAPPAAPIPAKTKPIGMVPPAGVQPQPQVQQIAGMAPPGQVSPQAAYELPASYQGQYPMAGSQAMPGQYPQAMPGQYPHAMPGQYPQAMPGQYSPVSQYGPQQKPGMAGTGQVGMGMKSGGVKQNSQTLEDISSLRSKIDNIKKTIKKDKKRKQFMTKYTLMKRLLNKGGHKKSLFGQIRAFSLNFLEDFCEIIVIQENKRKKAIANDDHFLEDDLAANMNLK